MAVGTVTYKYPRATAPDATLMCSHDEVVADLAWTAVGGGAEDPTDITHAMNLDPAVYSQIGQPEVSIIAVAQGTAQGGIKVAYKDANTITATKIITGAANTDVTWRITIKRPFSMGR